MKFYILATSSSLRNLCFCNTNSFDMFITLRHIQLQNTVTVHQFRFESFQTDLDKLAADCTEVNYLLVVNPK